MGPVSEMTSSLVKLIGTPLLPAKLCFLQTSVTDILSGAKKNEL